MQWLESDLATMGLMQEAIEYGQREHVQSATSSKEMGTAFISFMSLNDRTLMCTIISKSFTLESGMNTPLCLTILGHF